MSDNSEKEKTQRAAAKAEQKLARITQQFREAGNMTYELECEGQRLIVRVFPIETRPDGEWRIEARTSDAPEAVVASATATSRAKAFEEVARWWRDHAFERTLETFDWEAISRALTTVRAI